MQPNEPTIGLKLSQHGIPVSQAADYQLIFNSAWPSLVCGFDATVTLPPLSTQIVPHKLGFIPFTVATAILNGISIGRLFSSSENFDIGPLIGFTFDNVNIYLNSSNATTTYSVNIKCYNIDLTEPADYKLPQPPVLPRTYDPTFGMRIAKFNKSINSSDMRDFILDTQCQSPAVLAVVTPKSPLLPGGSAGTIAYLNPAATATFQGQGVPYLPWTYGFYSADSITWEAMAPGFQQAPPGFFLWQNINGAQGITVSGPGAVLDYSTGIGNSTAALVVLRDPLVVPQTIQVTY